MEGKNVTRLCESFSRGLKLTRNVPWSVSLYSTLVSIISSFACPPHALCCDHSTFLQAERLRGTQLVLRPCTDFGGDAGMEPRDPQTQGGTPLTYSHAKSWVAKLATSGSDAKLQHWRSSMLSFSMAVSCEVVSPPFWRSCVFYRLG